MNETGGFLTALATVLCVAAVTTVVFQRIRQPVVLGYIAAGLIVGPHVPVPLVADRAVIGQLSELGVILLMFSLGLEFSFRRLVAVARTAGVATLTECGLVFWLGFVAGRMLGWTANESVFVGAAVAISSTTIVAKAFDERHVAGRLRDVVFGILVVEDLVAVMLLASLTVFVEGRAPSASAVLATSARLAGFLLGTLAFGLFVIPRFLRSVLTLERKETTIVASLGVCFACALLARAAGYSVALGAFLAGVLAAESGGGKEIERLVEPMRNAFGAVFFVSVGMSIEPGLMAAHAGAIGVLSVVVIVGKVLGVSLGSFLVGQGIPTSVSAGMSLAQIGEFSFIIAATAATLGTGGGELFPVIVGVSAVTTLTTPWLIRASGRVSRWVDHKLPHRLQTFAALYAAWIEQLGSSRRGVRAGASIRRLVRLLVTDAVLIAAVVIGASLSLDRVATWAERVARIDRDQARLLTIVAASALALPFCVGMVTVARRLANAVARTALPRVGSGVDLATAPRKALVLALEMAIAIAMGAPLLAVTQPFLSGPEQGMALFIAVAALAFAFWRSTANLQGHVRAGAEALVEALRGQMRADEAGGPAASAERGEERLLPGLGTPVAVRLGPQCAAAGESLASLDLRARTGATVLAIERHRRSVVPAASERLAEGDVLLLAGTRESLEAARRLLQRSKAEAAAPSAK